MRFWTTITLILVLSAVGLTYEIAAGRVLAPFFGTSLVTWTSVIATILTGFSLGSALGGLLVGARADTVVVCGTTTSGCVRATVVDAVQSGFNVLVLIGRDGVFFENVMKGCRLSQSDIEEALREADCPRPEMKCAFLEADGRISIMRNPQ